jgi:hypothetical protein
LNAPYFALSNVFNFHLSQLRIKIEQLFGLLVNKWRVFKKPPEFVQFWNAACGCIIFVSTKESRSGVYQICQIMLLLVILHNTKSIWMH